MGRLVPVFDIFAGTADCDAQWVETVPGLGEAIERMRELAKQKPGRYFLFDREAHRVVAAFEVVPQGKNGRYILRTLNWLK